jgi:hypothetical protein
MDTQQQEMLDELKREFGIQWRVWVQDGEIATISSFPRKRLHQITLPLDSEWLRMHTGHELSHAKLAESLHPAFGGIEIKGAGEEERSFFAAILDLFLDVPVHDLMKILVPNLAQLEIEEALTVMENALIKDLNKKDIKDVFKVIVVTDALIGRNPRYDSYKEKFLTLLIKLFKKYGIPYGYYQLRQALVIIPRLSKLTLDNFVDSLNRYLSQFLIRCSLGVNAWYLERMPRN